MPWGKHKGEPIHSLPDRYLIWVAEEFSKVDVRQAAQLEMEDRDRMISLECHQEERTRPQDLFDDYAGWDEDDGLQF